MDEGNRNSVSLFVTSEKFSSAEITRMIGLEASEQHDKGTQIIYAPGSVRKFSTWELSCKDIAEKGANVEEQIQYIFSKIEDIPQIKKEVLCRLEPELKVVCYSTDAHIGINMSVEQLSMLTAINATLDINIYNLA